MERFKQYKPPTTKLPFEINKKYHVFLSFRGPDVRKTLVDHLYEALSAAGLNVFIDSEKLEKGEKISPTLEKAIKSSAICIPIFSKGYADSPWCLMEAAEMLKTHGLIIPLFYHVEPSHVRHPESGSSPFKQSFLKHNVHSNRYPRGEIDRWKKALQQICSRSGWSTDITQGYEARLVKTAVNDLLMTLDKVPLHVAKHPVAIDNVKNAIIQILNHNSGKEAVKVGIWGIGGIGKTTAAKAVYNQVYLDFDAASFIFNIRTTAAEARGLEKLQTEVLRNLCKYSGEVDNVAHGRSLFRERLGGKSVLLILDDVSTADQLDALVGDWLTSSSRVILTSRDKHILNAAGISLECIHEMSGLEIAEALDLFSWHAFLKQSPSSECEALSTDIVKACKGHPLSLEVIGSYLYDKHNDIGCWKEALHNITLSPKIHNVLYLSYSGLSDEEKEIFVDIACFFIGEHKQFPIIFWKSLLKQVDTSLSNLSMKLLIRIDHKELFDMHDHLRDMGRTIAEKEEKRTRLWKVAQLSTLSNNINLSRLRLSGGNPQRLEMLNSSVLRYLHLQNLSIHNMTEDTLAMLPRSLIWLRFEHCPFAIGTSRAVDKPRHSTYMDNIRELKVMQLKDCADLDSVLLSSLFSLCNELQHVALTYCKSLQSLPDNIGNLLQLQHLDLRCCTNLTSLPDTIGNLSQLQHMNLGLCDRLNNLPVTIGDLSKLEHLNLESCKNLNNLPSTIGSLSQLQNLNLRWCEGLSNLPDEIGDLAELKNLYLEKCRSLGDLPDSIGGLSKLQHLGLEGCVNLTDLPSTIGNLSELQHLDLKYCESLNNLPDTIANLPQRPHLWVRGCQNLRDLPPGILNRLKMHF